LGGFKAPEIEEKKGGSIKQYSPLFFIRFAAAFNPAKKPILQLTWVYTQETSVVK
jgi:restriction endonuclease